MSSDAAKGEGLTLQTLKTRDGRMRGLISDWNAWLTQADRLYVKFVDEVGESPFYFNEVASVGYLASAAAMAGFVPLAEYEIVKRGKEDKRVKVDGRADLWFSSGSRDYSFEFKKAWLSATSQNLAAVMQESVGDIACIDRDECTYAAGALICLVRDAHRLAAYEEFAASDAVDCAYHIGQKGAGGAYLFFKLKV